jgi:protein gp37
MSANSKIEWTDATWNPVRGCEKVSPGCKHCYAAAFAERFRGVPGHPYEQGFDLRFVPEKLVEPFGWSRSRMVFVNSMSDLFQDGVPDEFILEVCRVMQAANWHTYQILTKRDGRMRELLSGKLRFAAECPHIWWGVSVEDRKYGLPRIDSLRCTPAQVKFLSIEPLLEHLGPLVLKEINWVIVGGESGRGARSMEASWVESVRSHCRAEDVPFFFKQWGGVNKSKTGRILNGRTYDEYPAVESLAQIPDRGTRAIMANEFSRFSIPAEKTTVQRAFGNS